MRHKERNKVEYISCCTLPFCRFMGSVSNKFSIHLQLMIAKHFLSLLTMTKCCFFIHLYICITITLTTQYHSILDIVYILIFQLPLCPYRRDALMSQDSSSPDVLCARIFKFLRLQWSFLVLISRSIAVIPFSLRCFFITPVLAQLKSRPTNVPTLHKIIPERQGKKQYVKIVGKNSSRPKKMFLTMLDVSEWPRNQCDVSISTS